MISSIQQSKVSKQSQILANPDSSLVIHKQPLQCSRRQELERLRLVSRKRSDRTENLVYGSMNGSQRQIWPKLKLRSQ
jgi:hypothetical protein